MPAGTPVPDPWAEDEVARFPDQIADLIGFLTDGLPPDHPFASVRAMPAGAGIPEIWLLGSTDSSAACAAHFGTAFSFAHFINSDGGAGVTRAYARAFRPSPQLSAAQASATVFALCADTEEEAERLSRSRDLFIVRLYAGRGGAYPLVEEAERYPYSPREQAIVQHARRRTIAGSAGPGASPPPRPRVRVRRGRGGRRHHHPRPEGPPAVVRAAGAGIRTAGRPA